MSYQVPAMCQFGLHSRAWPQEFLGQPELTGPEPQGCCPHLSIPHLHSLHHDVSLEMAFRQGLGVQAGFYGCEERRPPVGSWGARHPLPPWLPSHPEHEYRGHPTGQGGPRLFHRGRCPPSPRCVGQVLATLPTALLALLAWLRLVPL